MDKELKTETSAENYGLPNGKFYGYQFYNYMDLRKEPINLLWSGGWDSTFRLLQQLVVEQRIVKPYYMIDPSRKSMPIEMDTIDKLRFHIIQRYPHLEIQLLPTEYFHIEDIVPDPAIFNAWEKIKDDRHIGAQYKWLASYCKQNELFEIELSLDKSTNQKNFTDTLTYHLGQEQISTTDQIIFKYFSLPLLGTSKKEMEAIADEYDWLDILKMTWFCHRPVRLPFLEPVPCGGCNPCLFTIEEGFGHRVPVYSRIFGRLAKKIYNFSFYKKFLRP